MKKSLIYIAAAAVAMVSCAKTEMVVTPAEGEVPITFTTYEGREVTKATAIGEGDSFRVSAYRIDTVAYFANQIFEWDGVSAFGSDPVYYWPSSGVNLDFYAVMPTKNQGTASTDIIIDTTSRTVAFTADGKTDFSAVLLANQGSYPSTTKTLKFGHKLTKASFKVKGADTNLKYVITGATVTADSKGTYSFSSYNAGSWALDSIAPNNVAYTIAIDDTVDYNMIAGDVIGESLYLLPAQRSAENTVKLTVSYKVFALDAQSNATDRLIYQGTRDLDLTQTAIDTWQINKSVVYSLVLPTSDDSEISFTAAVNGWNVVLHALPGQFSVSPRKKVYFSSGNLQATYNASTSSYSWGFASQQYGTVGNAPGNSTIKSQTDGAVVDLFWWIGVDGTLPAYGVCTTPYNDGDLGWTDVALKADWGTTIDNVGTWRTLTGGNNSGEWYYLMVTRKVVAGGEEKTSWGFGTVEGVYGCLVLPDNWDGSVYNNFVYGPNSVPTDFTIPAENTFNSTTHPSWAEMEAAGVVFLPVTGERFGSVDESDDHCRYWSSTGDSPITNDACAYIMTVTPAWVNVWGVPRRCGAHVRLVSDVE